LFKVKTTPQPFPFNTIFLSIFWFGKILIQKEVIFLQRGEVIVLFVKEFLV